jgi:hypothetical protein
MFREACRPPVAFCAPLLLLLIAAPAGAEFVNGVERFDGTTLDLGTWVPFNRTGMSQSGALTINLPDRSTDLTTRSLTAGVGDMVQVDVRVNAYNAAAGDVGVCGLYLTNDSRGTTATADLDSQFLSVFNIQQEVILVSHTGGDPPGDAPNLLGHDQPVGATYIYRITRLASGSARFEVLEGDAVLGAVTRQFQGVDDELHVSLYASGINATFDNVVVTPEPGAISVFAAAAGTLLLRRRRGPRG